MLWTKDCFHTCNDFLQYCTVLCCTVSHTCLLYLYLYLYSTVSVFVSVGGSTTRYIVKDLSIPPASSAELIQGGAKFVMQSSDVLKVIASASNCADVYVSVVDAISA